MREAAGYGLIVLILAFLAAGGIYLWYKSAAQKYRRHSARNRGKRTGADVDTRS